MTSLKSILLTGAALIMASLGPQTLSFAAHGSDGNVETPRSSAAQSPAREGCKRYRWEHIGHPEKGYTRRVCIDQKPMPQSVVAETTKHERKCKEYVRKHYGPSEKGVDTFKVVYVECPHKR